mmetsp:Transcript_59589/g.143911  ORF Transcript_59589/g.143911 Transcript_59589/m.143911 type:complete len:211 (+) Transcript_59589:1284-1916(+)
MSGLYLMACTGAVWTSSVLSGSALPLSGCRMCTRPESATETATSAAGVFFLCTNSTASGLKGSLSMLVMSNAATSYIFRALSSPTVTNNRPSWERAMASKVPMCDRKCFTNSMPSNCFFQNLMWPSTLPVTKNSVSRLAEVKQTVSLCMKLFSYISALGRLSRYTCAFFKTFFFFGLPAAGGGAGIGPASSSSSSSSSKSRGRFSAMSAC